MAYRTFSAHSPGDISDTHLSTNESSAYRTSCSESLNVETIENDLDDCLSEISESQTNTSPKMTNSRPNDDAQSIGRIIDVTKGGQQGPSTGLGNKKQNVPSISSSNNANHIEKEIIPAFAQNIDNSILLVNCQNITLPSSLDYKSLKKVEEQDKKVKENDVLDENISNPFQISTEEKISPLEISDYSKTNATDCEKFTVQKNTSVKLNKNTWKDLHERCLTNKLGRKVLPPDWTEVVSSVLGEVLPFCNILFKRHKLYETNSSKLAKFWFYCNISDCKLDGTATLNSSYSIDVLNKRTQLKHGKGKPKSFQSRPIRAQSRKILGEKAADMTYPSKLYHRKLSHLDDKLFQMGNLKDVPQSKNVITQCAYEYRKDNREDKSLINSLSLLKTRYNKEMKNKSVSGFIQSISFDPLTIGLWREQDFFTKW